MDVIFRGFLRILALTFEVFAKSSIYLLAGFFLAGAVHALLRGKQFGKNLSARGMRSILSAIGLGVLLPVCSCGVLPLAVALRRRKASPEATAAFAVATPENSEDTVALTAGLFSPGFAAFRVVASLLSGIVAGLFVMASEVWGPPDETKQTGEAACSDGCHSEEETDTCRPDPAWWARLKASVRGAFARRASVSPPEDQPRETQEERPGADPETPPATLREKGSRLLAETWRFGFREVLDEIAWPLLAGLLLSGFLGAALPSDFASSIPGGLLGQMIFAALIAVPLYLCASASTPLGAVLMAKGLAPAAVLVLFLTGPVTNAPTVLLFRRVFGRKFLYSVLLATLLVSFSLGLAVHLLGTRLVAVPGDELPFLERGVRPWEIVSAILFAGPFGLSLLRVGVSEGLNQVVTAFRGLVPRRVLSGFDAILASFDSLTPRRFVSLVAALAFALWAGFGFTRVPQGSVGFTRTLGRASHQPMEPGWHWRLPAPLGRTTLVPAGELIRLDLGYRAAGIPDPLSEDWLFAGNAWHAAYTTPGDNAEEASFVTGDQNLIEAKGTLHLRLSDPFRFAFEMKDGIEPVRPLALAVLKRLFAGRTIDAVLSEGRQELERDALVALNEALKAGALPVEAVSFNLLDLHPPQGAVTAFRDVGSASEDRERRKYEARGVAESSLPRARGEAAREVALAQAAAGERRLSAEGAAGAFRVKASGMRQAAGEVETRLYWQAVGSAVTGRPVIVAPGYVRHDIIQGELGAAAAAPAPTPPPAGGDK